MATNALNEGSEILSGLYFFADNGRNDVVAKNVPCGFPRLIAVERPFGGSNFAISRMLSTRHLKEHDVPVLRRAEARLKWVQKPHAQLAHFNVLNEHAMLRK